MKGSRASWGEARGGRARLGRAGVLAARGTMVDVSESETGGLPPAGTKDVVFLIDISGYVFRAFYALPPLTSEKGEPTGALYGVTSMILKLVREQTPHMLAVVMDGKGHSFRKELYDSYKANR